ncbi:40S ribosomal protein S3A [Cyanidioschyzon merolae strain 10D]|jgi:small subunit ribosomal protein S3Ae|uniref:Small ribosomal subunit protein eS1 n=1 Tax=Cyanidioschyzon merolae (strain NIES-3377 / 10D) TaxID=280699 RepID=M1VHI3_CYAM1|nr:40S ribosomal protein S3A [Cyanidioschyzon merolae strain 10D]BAM82807.1 40S ribosomal protein S3A [Cyanidioschyzon merolae strain 10D]|eukprot:XP_005538843.1 40S ribosomal protein S3A [Cyanidioschyzon merolae strain 10D]
MAQGKNKRLSKGKKGSKKKILDPYSRKEWYDVKAPSYFSVRQAGKTIVSKTSGTRIASESLKGRVFEISLADLQKDEDLAYRKIKLRCEDVQGRNCLTQFYGFDFTRDKLSSMMRKWQTTIEAHVDVKTLDDYVLRLFCIGFTKRRQGQIRKTSYCKKSQERAIRKKMVDIMVQETSKGTLRDFVANIIPEAIGKEIEKACKNIYPLQNVYIRKCKLIRAPKFDLTKLMEVHGDAPEDTGVRLEQGAAISGAASLQAETAQADAPVVGI